MEPKEFGEYLRKLRKGKKLTLEALGIEIGYTKAYLSNIENGRRGIPSPEILKKLAPFLGVSHTELMEHAGYISKKEITQLTDIGTHFATKARANSLFSDGFLNQFEEVLKRINELNELIGDPEYNYDQRLLLVDEMQEQLDRTMYSIDRIKSRLEKSVIKEHSKNAPDDVDTDYGYNFTKEFSQDIRDRGYFKMMEKSGYIEIPKTSSNYEERTSWFDYQLDQIIPAISIDSSRFYPAIVEAIDDFIFEEASDLRDVIKISPEGIRKFVNDYENSNSEFIKKLIDHMLPMSERHIAMTFDWPEHNRNLFIEIDTWLLHGSVSYKKKPLSLEDKKRILIMLEQLFPNFL
ncbi:helix-turn-helix transcriptional regulator [Paenibacillus algorifonticola]|uniref:helix-turn-helix domain-containing protein n=1 Tax=Paenibacillus algorifonticola TaxID=684063 RepID=UPI003D2CE4BE